jgi:hypothetical protein
MVLFRILFELALALQRTEVVRVLAMVDPGGRFIDVNDHLADRILSLPRRPLFVNVLGHQISSVSI